MGAFSLAENPFVVLPVSPRSTRAQVDAAYAARVTAHAAGEKDYLAARQSLISPEGRLAAEVSWLIDIEPTDAMPLMTAMAGTDASALLTALKNQPPLTRANVAADACGRFRSTDFIGPLAMAHSLLDVEEITNLINFDHAEAGMAPVDSATVDSALAVLARRHADAAIEAMAAAGQSETMRTALMEAPPSAASRFLEELLSQFGRGVDMRMEPVEPAGPKATSVDVQVADPEVSLFAPERPTKPSRLSSPRTTLLWIGVLVVVILALSAAAFEFGPHVFARITGVKTPANTSSVPESNTASPDMSRNDAPLRGMAPNGVAESPPPPHPTKVLSQNELRFCLFTKMRLSSLNPPFRTFGYISKVDAALADYNARCGNVKFRSNDYRVVTVQLRQERPRLQAEADGLVKTWSR
jgi:hypothetical protein